MTISANEYPIRAVGGNVLLRKIAHADVVTFLKLIGGRDGRVLQVGEVLGLGSRWTQERQWFPPFAEQNKARSEELERSQRALLGERGVSAWKPMIRTPDSMTARLPMAAFTMSHKLELSQLAPGDLVIYNQARIFETFPFQGDDVILYPGNWIYAIVEEANLTERPELREYDQALEA